MRITRRRLRQIIREATIDRSTMPTREFQTHPPRSEPQHSKWPKPKEYVGHDRDGDDGDAAEYDRGYQDGFDNYPVADNATPDYDAGYGDGKLDADLPETDWRASRSEDW